MRVFESGVLRGQCEVSKKNVERSCAIGVCGIALFF